MKRGRAWLAAAAALLGVAVVVLAIAHRSQRGLVFGRYSARFASALILAGLAATALGLLAWKWPRLPPGRLGELTLALVSGALAFVGFDLLAGRLWSAEIRWLVPDAVTHHRSQPGRHFETYRNEYAVWHTVNSLGYRGPERPRRKPAGVKRVWLLGDSFTFGKGVADAECYSAVLEERLNAGRTSKAYEVLNGGVISYAPLIEYLDLEHHAFSFEPDIVVLAFDVSDLLQETSYRSLARFGADGTPLAVDGRPPAYSLSARVERWLRRRSYFWAWALGRLDAWEWDRGREQAMVAAGGAPSLLLEYTLRGDQTSYAAQWAAVEDSLTRIARACRRHGAAFALLTYPWGHQVNASEWAEGRREWGVPEGIVAGQPGARRLAAFAAREGVPFWDMTGDFRRATTGPLYFSHDMHWTAAGHRVAAESLHAFLSDQGRLAP